MKYNIWNQTTKRKNELKGASHVSLDNYIPDATSSTRPRVSVSSGRLMGRGIPQFKITPKLNRQQCCAQNVNPFAPSKFQIPSKSRGLDETMLRAECAFNPHSIPRTAKNEFQRHRLLQFTTRFSEFMGMIQMPFKNGKLMSVPLYHHSVKVSSESSTVKESVSGCFCSA